MKKFKITDEPTGKRPLPDWIGDALSTIKQRDEGITAGELSTSIGVSKQNMLRIFNDIGMEPVDWRLIGGQRHAIFSTEELRRLAREFNDGKRWRKSQ